MSSLRDDIRSRLESARLYVLAGPSQCSGEFEATVRAVLDGGAQVIQLREKARADRELLQLARHVRRWTREAGVLFIMNDRPDLAVLSDADGVHVGQEELSVADARSIVGPDRLVGVSAHTIEQARAAVADGADYIGVGPTFPSETKKEFEKLAGLDFVRQAVREIGIPAFAIGGITLENVDDVLAAGTQRIAVGAAVCSAADPALVIRALRERLDVGRPR